MEFYTRTSTSTFNVSHITRAGAPVLSRVQIMYILFTIAPLTTIRPLIGGLCR